MPSFLFASVSFSGLSMEARPDEAFTVFNGSRELELCLRLASRSQLSLSPDLIP